MPNHDEVNMVTHPEDVTQQPPPTPAEPQDLHLARSGEADPRWRNIKPPGPVASNDRLQKPSQTVTLHNTHRFQMHVVVDRFMRGIELQPGQRIEGVEMLVEDIEHFRRMRKPKTYVDPRGVLRHYEQHPVIIEGAGANPHDRLPDAEPPLPPGSETAIVEEDRQTRTRARLRG